MQDLTPLPQVAPLPGEAEDPDGPAATLRRSLVRERERHVEARRELKSVSASARRRQAALFLLLLLVAAWGYFVFENKQPTEADLDALVSACRAHPGADPDPSLAASCEQLLSRLFDELTVACTAGEGAAVAPVEARCARVEQLAFTVARERAEGYRAEYQQAVAAVEQRRPGFDQALSAVLRRFGSAELQIDSLPPPFVEEIGRLLDELQAPASHSSLQRQLCRREGCFALFAPHFKRYGLPELYGYLAWQESGFRSGEESPAGAVGLWQLMVPTAEHYGLVVSEPGLPGSDERLEPAKATRAAARYLRDLRKIFRDSGLAAPLLVVAAYNSGQGRILQNQDALVPVLEAEGRDASERADFITLWLHEKLPRETLRYVPRILALAMIGESPEAFGFDASRCARRGCG